MGDFFLAKKKLLTGLASRSRKETHVFGPLEPEPEPLEEKNQQPEPLQKQSGAGAAKHMRLLYRLLEDKRHKGIVHLLLFIGVSTWPQSPSFPQKLATALKNKTSTLYSAIHVYHRCLTINRVCILTLIVSNRLYFPKYTYS